MNELALPLLRKYAKADRLFAWIHYSDPHAPYILPEGAKNPFLGDALFQGPGDRPIPARIVSKGYTLDGHTDLKYYVAQYDANVLVADQHIQKLLDEMRSLGLLEDSLIVFAADHGEELGEHNSWFEHGPLPYNTTAHVPLFFVMNGLAAGRSGSTGRWSWSTSIRPCGTPSRRTARSPGIEGHSLWPLIRGDRAGGADPARADLFREAFSEAGHHPNLYHSVQEGTWKLVFNSGGKHSRAADSPTGGFELYDLKADPLETNNLAATQTDEVRRLKRALVDVDAEGPRQRRGGRGERGDGARVEGARVRELGEGLRPRRLRLPEVRRQDREVEAVDPAVVVEVGRRRCSGRRRAGRRSGGRR